MNRTYKLTLQPCTFTTNTHRHVADCGTLVVPENPAKDNSRSISLPITRIRASGDEPTEPIFWLAGGPGLSNMKFKPSIALLMKYDFVMVGYRGVDGSSVLDCPEYVNTLRIDNPLSDSSLTKLSTALTQSMAQLQTQGVELSCYTMREVIADMEAARLALGYGRVNLLSQSYGTRIAQVYAYMHPESIYRSVMIGVNPPGRFIWEPETIDAQLTYYAHLYAQDKEIHPQVSNLVETMHTVIRKMPRQWLFLPIDVDKVKIITFLLLFNRRTAAMVFDAYVTAEKGDFSGLALMSSAYDLVVPSSVVWGDLFAKAVSADLDSSRDYRSELDPPGSILGSPVSKLQWGSIPAENWPIPSLPLEFRQVHPSNIETLLVSGSIDFSTPAHFATDELLPYLTHGKQMILAEMGHTSDLWNLQPQATERLLTSFYDNGIADDSCYVYAPMNFNPSPKLPMLVKIALAVVLLTVTTLAKMIRYVSRRVHL